MRIFKHLRSDWFRYGFETIAVVVGILVAFALDNWNEDRKQALLETEYLNGLAAEHVSEFNEVSSRHLVEIGNVVRNYAKLHNFQTDIYDNSFIISKNEWDFMNDPLSEKFQSIEYTVVVYRLNHTAFLNHFLHLKELSVQLLNDVQKELSPQQ